MRGIYGYSEILSTLTEKNVSPLSDSDSVTKEIEQIMHDSKGIEDFKNVLKTFNTSLPTENDKITTFADYQRLTRHAQDIDSKQSATLLARLFNSPLTCRSPLSMFLGLSTNGAPFAFRLLLQKLQCSQESFTDERFDDNSFHFSL